jgi:hypothetical protein
MKNYLEVPGRIMADDADPYHGKNRRNGPFSRTRGVARGLSVCAICVLPRSLANHPNANGGNPTIYWTTYTYDGSGRTTKATLADGSVTTYVYSGNTVTVTDPVGNWKKFTMDAFGNLTQVVEPDGTQTNTNGQATTTYTYDILNHLIGVSMPPDAWRQLHSDTDFQLCYRQHGWRLFAERYES